MGCLASLTDPREWLVAIARLHLTRPGKDKDLAVVFQVEFRHSANLMERFSSTYFQEYLGRIRDVIADGKRQWHVRADLSATTAAKILVGARCGELSWHT